MVQEDPASPSFWQVVKSVLGALFGVQSTAVRDRDFTHGKPWIYVVVGLVAVILFVLLIFGVVKWVVSEAGL